MKNARPILVLVLAVCACTPPGTYAQRLPERLTNEEFWSFVNTVSEPGGYFRSDNFLSNERQYQWVIPDLLRATQPGGVYLGVGPEQNFTYIVALQPRLSIIFDIRRQNMLEHLLYKALFELATDRADFLSRLFCRARPAGLDTLSSISALMQAYHGAERDTLLGARTRADAKRALAARGFTLSSQDHASIDYVYNAFCEAGVAIDYGFGRSFGGFGGWMPSYQELMVATDQPGTERSYLASEASFRYLQSLHARNLIVPVVGDFAGPKAIRTVGEYLRARGATVTAFYVSNVEQYLFQDLDNWRRFYENVATLPLDDSSMFIRSLGGPYRNTGRRASVISHIQEIVQAYANGQIQHYGDVITRSR